jgi:hypothetical protein
MLDYVETLCEFKMKTKCITVKVSISGQPVNTAKDSTNIRISVIQINFQTSPKPYTTYSLWYPQSGNFFKNVFILKNKQGSNLINYRWPGFRNDSTFKLKSIELKLYLCIQVSSKESFNSVVVS